MKDIYDLAREKIIITAEIGINHNGDIKTALEMINAAADCGVDAVKFQGFKTEQMYSRLTPGFSHTKKDVFSQIKQLEVGDDWWGRLKQRASKKGLYFSASLFDHGSLDLIKKTGLDFIKIASAEINNLELIQAQSAVSDIFVVSTGMAYLEEVSQVVRMLTDSGITKIILLECTSSYPSPPESIHLLNIDFLRNTFGHLSGFSDHALGIHHSIAAAARGARFIEKHFTLDQSMAGPDQNISADPAQMKELVRCVREVEISLKGNRKQTISEHETDSRQIGRKSIIACRDINKGETINRQNTIIKRPGKGIPPGEARFIYGRKAAQAIKNEQWITWEMVE